MSAGPAIVSCVHILCFAFATYPIRVKDLIGRNGRTVGFGMDRGGFCGSGGGCRGCICCGLAGGRLLDHNGFRIFIPDGFYIFNQFAESVHQPRRYPRDNGSENDDK